MSEPTVDANGSKVPAGSPSANNDNGQNGNVSTPPVVPFYEDPKIQEYIKRQVEERLSTIMPPASQSHPASALSQEDELVEEYVRDLNLDKSQARVLVQKIKKAASLNSPQQNEAVSKVEWLLKVNDLVAEFPDASGLNTDMDKIFQSKSKEDKELILRSKDGLKYLYLEARNKKPANPMSSTGGSFGGNPVPSGVKTGEGSIHHDQAVKAALSGDRAGYEANVRKIAENGGFKK